MRKTQWAVVCEQRLYDSLQSFKLTSDAAFRIQAAASMGHTPLCSDGEACRLSKLILVVDDNAFIRHSLYQLFTSQGDFAVCGEAENGSEAIENAQALHPDIIVMDLSMPVMNGIDAARALKKLMPTVPIIMFSEYDDAFSENEARSAGVSALVSKSKNVSALLVEVRRLSGLIAA
jgi:CheY-like chemotaxis protein